MTNKTRVVECSKVVVWRLLLCLAFSALVVCSVWAKVDVLCIYYPEWHAYPEGDAIFGKGCSEWNLVDTAIPRFEGHEQPVRLVGGKFDDSDPVAVAREIELASGAGIDVFVYDWYWAEGRPIQHESLERGFFNAANRGKMKFAPLIYDAAWADGAVSSLMQVVTRTRSKRGPVTVSTNDIATVSGAGVYQWNGAKEDGYRTLLLTLLDASGTVLGETIATSEFEVRVPPGLCIILR